MYNMELFEKEGFSKYYDKKLGVVIGYKNEPIFLTNVFKEDFETDDEMNIEALEIFEGWLMHCVYTNDHDWWV